jgi:hypothetical protein
MAGTRRATLANRAALGRRAAARALTALAAATATAAIALALGATDAAAGVYTVHSCKSPDGSTGHAGDWKVTMWDDEFNHSGSICPSGYFWLDMSPTRSHHGADYIRGLFRSPSGTTIHSYRIWRSAQLGNTYNYRFSEWPGGKKSNRIEVDHCLGMAGCRSIGRVSDPLGFANLFGRTAADDVRALDLLLTCGHTSTGSAVCPPAAPAARVQLHRAEITLEDLSEPTLTAQPSGALVTSGARLTGVHSVAVQASDKGGGVYVGQVEVDGRVVAEAVLDRNGGRCVEPFVDARPCPSSASGLVHLDTAKLADGAHSVRILVADATRTNVVASAPVQLTTDNNACNADPRTSPRRIFAWVRPVGGRRASRRARSRRRGRARAGVHRVRYGSPLRLAGRVTDGDGGRVAGARVCVLERRSAGRRGARIAGIVTTDARGRFSLRLPGGPSRRVSLVHRTGGVAAARSLRLRVPAPVRLRPSGTRFRVGEQLLLRGRLRGRPLPKRGAVVVLQARQGGAWITFATTRTDRRGRFRYGYRFVNTTGVRTYPMRAIVPRQGGHPFARGRSRTIRVRVRG